MKKPSSSWSMLVMSIVVLLLAACSSITPTNTTSTSTDVITSPGQISLPTGEKISVLDGYSPQVVDGSRQQMVVYQPGSVSSPAPMTLPFGLISQDHQRIYTAVTRGNKTTISVVSTQNGKTIRSFVIPATGNFTTTGQSSIISAQGYGTSVISTDGHWLALLATDQSNNTTTIALTDTQNGQLIKLILLAGRFDLDALSPDGKTIYVLQYLSDAPGHYAVTSVDVPSGQLAGYPILDKTAPQETSMIGGALTRLMAQGGNYAYTLYIDTIHNHAFLHILLLDTSSGLRAARCLDLPKGTSADLLHFYTMALSADGRTLYTANAALGVVSTISLNDPAQESDIFDIKLNMTQTFSPGNVHLNSSDKTRMFYNGAEISADQKMLYFAGLYGIWAVDTSDLHIQGHYLATQAFTGIALSSDHRTLYAIDPINGITLLDFVDGRYQQVIQGSTQTPWGIAWINN